MKITLITLLFLILFGVSCSSSRKKVPTADLVPSDFLYKLDRSPCFGTCPVYKVQVTQDGLFEYTGIKFTDRSGVWTRQISPEERERLLRAIVDAGFRTLKSEYKLEGISDAVSVTHELTWDMETFKILNQGNGPASLNKIETLVDSISKLPGFIFVRPLQDE